MRNLLRRFAVGVVLVGFHSLGVFWAWWQVTAHPGFLSGLHWAPIALIDFPLSFLIEWTGADDLLDGPAAAGLTLLLGGGLYWMLIGFALQAAWRRFMNRMEWG